MAMAKSASSSSPKNFIQGAIKHPGALTATAKQEGGMNPDGTIKRSWLMKAAKKPGVTGRRARFAITLSKLRKKK